MGKRVAVASSAEHQHGTPADNHITRTIRKRKRAAPAVASKAVRLSGVSYWHGNDYEDSSSNDTITPPTRNQSSKHANNSSILLNTSLIQAGDTSVNESPKPVYTLHPSVVNGTILYDLKKKPWRLGKPIGKGNFGEIFLASDNTSVPVTNENAKFVVKIEPHSNGPLFVEIHCLMNTAKKNADNDEEEEQEHAATTLPQIPPSGIPDYIASGSHFFGDARYRFLVLQRFDRDLHSLIKNCRVHQKSVLTLALHIVNVLENLHDKGYCHNDVKAQNLMISKCKYQRKTATTNKTSMKSKYDEQYEEKQQTTDSGNSSEQDAHDDDEDFVIKHHLQYDEDEDEDEDFDDDATTNSINSNSMDIYETPINKNRKRRARNALIEFSGSNPVRSCRRQKQNSTYDEMVKSHYLRPSKRVSYSEFFNEDGLPAKDDAPHAKCSSSDDDSEEFVPRSARRLKLNKKSAKLTCSHKRLTRRQEKLQTNLNHSHQQTARGAAAAINELLTVEEERIFLIDYGLASKFMDNGVHRPFVMDQRRAHDGTLEFTSRDAHMGAHSRRSDLECLGYNLIFWSQGYLPWKDAATQHQQEKVHRAKEYLMTDVREMLKQIYGKQVPKYLGEFLQQVGQLAYHERPDYARYRRIFEREYQQLGYALADMPLGSHEIVRTCVRIKEEIENKNDIFEMNKNNSHAWSIMKNLSVGTPFHERTLSNRVSPKNLRSKSDKKAMKKKKFSWAEILSQDPDQIARERAEKEFDREEELSETQQPPVRRYEGKPTYAILEIQQRLKLSGRLVEEYGDHSATEDNEDENGENEKGDVVDDDDDDDEDDVTGEEEDDEEQEEGSNVDMEEWEQDKDELDADTDEEENEDSDEEQDGTETETTEVSEHGLTNGRKRHTRNTRTLRRTTSNRRTTTKATTQTTTTVTRGAVGNAKRAPVAKPKASKSSRKRVSTIKTTQTVNGKRGGATRLGRKVGAGVQAASAAGEIEHSTPKYLQNGHGHNGNGVCGGKPPERRTRRCLIKTDAEVEVEEEESNSNFSPDVGSLFNVWKKINNENMYFRGSTAAARHCKK